MYIDRTTYVKYETGSSEPNFATLVKLAEYFGVSTDYLLGVTAAGKANGDQTTIDNTGREDEEAVMVGFGERLKQLRKERGLTQEQLAEVLSVERSSIGKYEGKSGVMPSDDVKKRMAEYFDVSFDYLMGRTVERDENPSNSAYQVPIEPKNELEELLAKLSPAEVQMVKGFILGLTASRK